MFAATGSANPNAAGIQGTNPVTNEMDWQTRQALSQIGRDVEVSFVTGTFQEPTDNSKPRRTRRFLDATKTNVITIANAAALTEAMILDLLQKVWLNGGIQVSETATLMCGAWQKRMLTAEFNDFAPAMAANAAHALKPALLGVRQEVQQHLFAGLAAEITGLAGTYLPLLRIGLGKVATGLNAGAGGIAAFAREGCTVGDVTTILDSTSATVGNLAKGVQPFLQALRDIAAVGAEFLPGFGSGLADGAQKFATFIAQARQSGQLREWLSAGLSAVGDLVTVLRTWGRSSTQCSPPPRPAARGCCPPWSRSPGRSRRSCPPRRARRRWCRSSTACTPSPRACCR
jgi:hypothetical protein